MRCMLMALLAFIGHIATNFRVWNRVVDESQPVPPEEMPLPFSQYNFTSDLTTDSIGTNHGTTHAITTNKIVVGTSGGIDGNFATLPDPATQLYDQDGVITFPLPLTAKRSLSCWVRINSGAFSCSGELFSQIVAGGSSLAAWAVRLGRSPTTGTVWLTGVTGGETTGTAVNTITKDVWHHIAVVYDSAASGQETKLFVDGSFLTSVPGVQDTLEGTLNLMGKYRSTDGYQQLSVPPVSVDTLKVYNVALTSGQVLTLSQEYTP